MNSQNLTVADRFRQMNLTLAMDSTNLAKSWLKKHNNCFYGFLNGHFSSEENIKKIVHDSETASLKCYSIKEILTDHSLCDIYAYGLKFPNYLDYNMHHTMACETEELWRKKSPDIRSETLYNIAKTIEKFQDLMAEVESITSEKQLSRIKAIDIPNLIDSFYFYAGVTLGVNFLNMTPKRIILVVEDTYPTLAMSLQVASLLAAGQSVNAFVNWKHCLSAFLLAEICSTAGLPPGLLNIIPVSTDCANNELTDHLNRTLHGGIVFPEANIFLHEVVFTRRPTVIVYESADLHAAAAGVIQSFHLYSMKSVNGGCKVLIQQSIAETFLKILKEKFQKITVKNVPIQDIGHFAEKQDELLFYLKEAEKHGQVFKLQNSENEPTGSLQPMIISGLETGSKLVYEELGGPVIVTVTFRTQKESISMFNSDNKGSPVSIWTEVIPTALEVIEKLQTGTIWVNTQNIFDPTVPFFGVYGSGNTVVGGKEGLCYLNLNCKPSHLEGNSIFNETIDFRLPANNTNSMSEYKLYIDGALKHSKDGKVAVHHNSIIPCGSEADVLTAVSAAVAAQPKWQASSAFQKREVLLSIAKHMENKEKELIKELEQCGYSSKEAEDEILNSRNALRHWAFKINNHSGEVKDVYGKEVLQVQNPLGVIAIQCSNTNTLKKFFNSIATIIALGNTIILLASESHPVPALTMGEIFSQTGVPKGVINVISGPTTALSESLLKHMDVNSIWLDLEVFKHFFHKTEPFFGSLIHKRIYFNDDNSAATGSNYEFLVTFVKSIYLPKGEIFAN